MIGIWFKEDIIRILAEHRYVVVTNANGKGEFQLKYFLKDVRQMPITVEYSEIEAKYLSESEYVNCANICCNTQRCRSYFIHRC